MKYLSLGEVMSGYKDIIKILQYVLRFNYYNFNKKDNLQNLDKIETEVVTSICTNLDTITIDSQFHFGI